MNSKTILFVENHGAFAETVKRQFLSQHNVTVVTNLSAARQAVANTKYDILLVDYDLDDGKGDALVRELKAAKYPVPIIGVSSHDSGNHALLIAGASAVCNKMQFEQINRVLETVLAPAVSDLLWWVIPGVLAGMPMPYIHAERRMNFGGPVEAYDDELHTLKGSGIGAVVSLLNLASDKSVYESAGFRFLCLPIPDGGAPTHQQALQFVDFVDRCRSEKRAVAVHCQAGLGRTGTMLAAYFVAKGDSAETAISRVRMVERAAIETFSQVEFLTEFSSK